MNKHSRHQLIVIAFLAQLYGQGGGQGYGDMLIMEIPFTHIDLLLEEGNNNWDFTNYNQNSADNEDYSFTLNVLDTVIIDISVCNPITDFDTMLGVFRKTPDSTYVDTNLVCIYPEAGQGFSLVDCFAEDTQACTEAIGGSGNPGYESIIYGYVLLPDSNRALEFDGTDDYVDVPHNNSLNISENNGNEGTIMARIKLDDITSNTFRRIISKKNNWDDIAGYGLEYSAESQVIIFLAGSDNYANASFTPSTDWIYIVATFNSTSANIYLDGVDITNDGIIGAITSNTAPLWIGAISENIDENERMDGKIDEIAIWDTELSAAEVAEIYNNGISKNANIDVGSYTSSSSLVAYWRFNEESGNTVQDVSINNNSGIINGGSTRIANGTTAATYYIVVDSYSEVSGNPNNFQINVAYTVPPFITGYTLDSLNSYVEITINENTYSSATPWSSATALQQENFIISDFQQNGGTAPEPEINGIWGDTTGVPLVGGELTIRLSLEELVPPSSGVETFQIKPVNSTSIYDGGGTPMEDTTTTGIITLNGDPVTIVTAILADDNSYVTITFNDTVYSDQATTVPLNIDDFDVSNFQANGGVATLPVINSITNTGGNPLQSGELTVRLNLDPNPATGVETFEIKPTTSTSIYNRYGTPMSETATSGEIHLNDNLAPTILTTNLEPNNFISFTASERLYKDETGENEVDQNNFECIIDASAEGSNAETVTVNSVITPQEGSTQYLYNLNLTVDPPPSGVETVYVRPRQDAPIYDGNGNVMSDSTAILPLNDKLPPILVPDNSSLEESNSYVILTFTEGLYTDDNGNNPVTPSDFSANIITIDNATTASITSVLDSTGSTLLGGETSIRLNMNYDNPPSGVETMEIRPQENQVFDSAGNAVIGSTNDTTFTLNDALAPSVTFNPEDNSLIYPYDVFMLTLSEDVQLLDNSPVNSTNIDSQLTVAYIDGSAENISFSANIENNVITITPGSDLGEIRQLRVSILDGLEDLSGNQMDIHTADYTVRDISPPEINTEFSSIITSNAFVKLSFSEGVFTNGNGTGALEISDFILEFDDNGGNATAAEITSLQRPGPSGPLLGGEDSIWVYLSITGTPNGNETIIIQSNGNEAIYDGSGNPLSSPNNSTSTITLFPYPWLDEYSLDYYNGYVELIFSEGVFSASDPLSAVDAGDFNLSFSQNNGNATGAYIDSLRNTNDLSLSGGETTIRAVISLYNSLASGVETIQITPTNTYSVCNNLGNRLAITDCTVNLTLNDRLPPTITAADIASDTIISLSVSEGIYNILSGGVASTDFHLEFYSNNGNASTAQIINVSNTSQGALNGGETTIYIGFATDSLPSGSEEIEFHPASITAIYDSAYNAMLQTTISERVTLPDQLPPRIIAPTADISSDNSYVIFSLTEGVYGVSEITAPVEPNDFAVEFIQNGGNATGAEVNYITNYRQFPVIGGEDILRCYLTIQGTPSGNERLYIRATNDNSVFDLAGNGMDTSQVTDTLQLYDQLVPTVDSVSIPHGSPIGSSVESPIMITFSEPIQSFGYSVSARHYSYLTYSTDTTATSFKVTLQPPMASLDTITLSIFNLTDNSGLEAVDFSYEFYTPPLGDYEPYDGKVNVLDLAQFVSFWMADSQPAILGLGPTSGTFPHLVPLLDEEYNLDDGMTFIRMWSWSLDRFGLEPLTSPTIGIAMNWDKLVVDIPMEAIAGQVYLRYNPLQGKVDLSHTAFGNNNLTLKREAVENGEILLEFGLVEPDDNARVISIKPEINEPAEATVIYKFFAADQSLIAAGTQKIALVIPTEFRLMQNYPNPFNNTTTIRYAVPEETFVQLEIFDIKGRLVETLTSQSHQPGFYALQWAGRRAASGVYFIKLEADKTVLTQKMILLK